MSDWVSSHKLLMLCIFICILSSFGLHYWYTHGYETPLWISILSLVAIIIAPLIAIMYYIPSSPETCPKCGSTDLWSRYSHSTTEMIGKTPIVEEHYDYVCNNCKEKFSD